MIVSLSEITDTIFIRDTSWEKVSALQAADKSLGQGNFLSLVNLLLPIHGDVAADNIPVIKSMNRGFDHRCLSFVLLVERGKQSRDNCLCPRPCHFQKK